MLTIEQIETAILTLAPDEFQRLRQWFSNFEDASYPVPNVEPSQMLLHLIDGSAEYEARGIGWGDWL